MLNPWIAITFQAARLGLEAQNAMALRLMRLVADATKTEAHGMIADKIAAPPEQTAATKVVPDSARRHEVLKKVHKRVRANMRRRSK